MRSASLEFDDDRATVWVILIVGDSYEGPGPIVETRIRRVKFQLVVAFTCATIPLELPILRPNMEKGARE